MENTRGRRRRKKSKWPLVFMWIIIFTVAALIISYFAIHAANDILGFKKPDRTIDLTVERGMTVRDVAELLEEKGVIEQSNTFVLYSKFRNKGGIIQAGDYVLNSNMGYDTIIANMQKGNHDREMVALTFYEGMSALEIANLLDEKGVCDRDEFLNVIETENFGFEFENMLPIDNPLRFRHLEGYLFPDTYQFFLDEDPYSVAKKFLKNFEDKVFEPLYDDIRNYGYTLDEAVTLASVIQEEASVVEEMYNVSSVFNNRLHHEEAGIPLLQSDVTYIYVENDIMPFHKKQNQEMYDAYNTYVCKGLPVGPICSPGVDAVKAAINPNDTDYYYFVTDANGKFYYSKTLKEHERNVRLAFSVKKEN